MTNNRDYLSQEEIDALLRQSADDSPEPESETSEPSIDTYLSVMEQDALGEIGNITFGNAATALSTLLGRKVEITTPFVSVVPRSELDKEFPHPHVAVHVKYVDGFEGINLLVIKTEDAHVIADLMLGGEGKVTETELTEIHLSAVQEAMNQMMGSSATSMSTIFNRMVNISPPGINILDLAAGEGTEHLPDENVFIKVSFRLTIEDLVDSTIMQLLTVSFTKEMVHSLLGQSDPAESEVAAAAAIEEMPALQPELPADPPPAASQMMPQAPVQPPVQPPPQIQHAPSVPPQQPAYSASQVNRNVQVQPVQYADFSGGQSVYADEPNLDLLLDIPLRVTVELGRTKKVIREILDLSQGSIIELDKLAGEPVDILVNNKLIAKGEVVVIDENFGVRVTDIVSQKDRIQKLQ